MIRARTLVALRRWTQRAAVRALMSGADGLSAAARSIGPCPTVACPTVESDGAAPDAARSREAMRASALRTLVEAIHGRDLRPGESSIMMALQLVGSLKRQAGSRPAGSAVESMREFALRQLVNSLSERDLEPNESPIARALELAKAARAATRWIRRDPPMLGSGS